MKQKKNTVQVCQIRQTRFVKNIQPVAACRINTLNIERFSFLLFCFSLTFFLHYYYYFIFIFFVFLLGIFVQDEVVTSQVLLCCRYTHRPIWRIVLHRMTSALIYVRIDAPCCGFIADRGAFAMAGAQTYFQLPCTIQIQQCCHV